MEEFEAALKKMMSGDLTLVDQFGSIQLAITAAIKQVCKTPEVIRMFAKKQPVALRKRLSDLKAVGKGQYANKALALEILSALTNLGEKLSLEEQEFLNSNMTAAMAGFTRADNRLGEVGSAAILAVAGSQVKKAQN